MVRDGGRLAAVRPVHYTPAESHRAPVAQRIERQVADLKAVGSSPAGRATRSLLPAASLRASNHPAMQRAERGLDGAGRSRIELGQVIRRCARPLHIRR